MEVIMSPPVQEGSVMENDKGDGSVKLSKSKKKRLSLIKKIKFLEAHNARLEEKLESLVKREDTVSSLGKTAIVDKKMSESSSVATTGDERSLISGMEIEKGNGVVKLTRSQKKKLKASVESLDKREDTENTKSKPEVSFNTISPSLPNNDNPYSGTCTTATVDKKMPVSNSVATTGDEKSSISRMEIEKGNGAVKLTYSGIGTTATVDQKNRVSSSSATGDEKSSISKIEAPSDGMGSRMITNLNMEVKTQNKMETAVGETGSGTNATDTTTSKKRKRPKKKNNPESGDGLSTCENTQDKTVTVDQNNRVSSSCATGDEKSSISKIEAPNGEMASSTAANLNVEVKTQNQMETAVGETGSGTNATDTTTSKKRKRAKKKNNPESGDGLSTCENTQDKTVTVDQNNRVSSSPATKNSISEIEAPSGGMGSSVITNLNVEVKTQNQMETAVGETGSGTNATDTTTSKKRKSPKKKNNPESVDGLSTCENAKDTTVTVDQNNRVSSSCATGDEKSSISKTEAPSGEMGSSKVASLNVEVKTQNQMETAVGETGSGTNATDTTTSKKRERLKKKNNPESGDGLSTCENTQDKTVIVDQNNRVSSSSATSNAKSLISRIEAPSGEMGLSAITNLNVEVKTQNQMETAVGETGSGTNATDTTTSKKRKRPKKKNNPESGDGLSTCENKQDKTVTVDQNNRVSSSSATRDEKSSISKIESPSGEMGSSMITKLNVEVKRQNKMEIAVGETGSGTNASDDTSKKRKRPKKKKSNPESGDVLSTRENTPDKTVTVDQNNRVSSAYATGDEKITVSKIEASSGKTDSSMVTSPNEEVKTQNKMETVVGETGSGAFATDNTPSKTSKRPKKKIKDPESGDILSTRENTQDKTATVSSSATGDEKSSITKLGVSSGKSGSSIITSLNAEVKTQNKMETTVGETGSGTNATDNTASKKRKRQKGKNKNPESSDILSCHENTLDKTATPDANMVSKGEDNTKVVNGNMGLSANTNINVNNTVNPDKKPESKDKSSTLNEISNPGPTQVANDDKGSRKISESTHELGKRKRKDSEKLASGANLSTIKSTIIAKNGYSTAEVGEAMNGAGKKKCSKRPTIGEILNPRYLEALDAGISPENMEHNKSQGLNENHLASSSVLSTGESTQDTKKPLIALSNGLEREDHPKTANGEKGPSIIAESTMLKGIAYTEVTNIVEAAELEIAEAKANTILPIKMGKQNIEVQEKTQVTSLGKKLVILDVNGLLADIVCPRPKDIMADYLIPRRAIFKRPFLDDFLSFCFERFHVGIWSSRRMQSLKPVVDFLLGDWKKKLLFLWDASKCTNSGMKTLEERHKCLVLKDLRKIWEKNGPHETWLKGTFNESNTLLLDDSPYKALANPKHSGIFPVSYSYKNRDDNFLAPKGELQNYLEGLAASDNVKTYVEQHPFGQSVIDETHPNWSFYSRVINGRRFR